MIINNFDFGRPPVRPTEANPELIVDADTPLALAIATQRLQPVARRGLQVSKGLRQVKLHQLAQGLPFDIGPTPHMAKFKQPARIRIAKGPDHILIITLSVNNVNH